MERIEDFAALSPLLTAQLKPGVYTNHLMAPGDYDREIAAGLTVFPFPGGLWLRRSRAGHCRFRGCGGGRRLGLRTRGGKAARGIGQFLCGRFGCGRNRRTARGRARRRQDFPAFQGFQAADKGVNIQTAVHYRKHTDFRTD